MKLLLCVYLVMSSIGLFVEGNTIGAPTAACDGLAPNPTAHGAQPQINASPYAINLMPFYSNGSFTYYPGMTYTLSISNGTTDGGTFRGFFVQARQMSNDANRVGIFAPIGAESRLSSCAIDTDGVTHTSSSEKTTIYFNWTAPVDNSGAVTFGFAVVRTQINYWANMRTGEVQQAVAVTTSPGTTTFGATTGNSSAGLTASVTVWVIGIALISALKPF